jgi:general secretion pathway protein G
MQRHAPLTPSATKNTAQFFTPGFTLMEVLIVMVIIGVLSTLGFGSFQSSQQKGRDSKRKAELKQIGVSLEAYYNDKGEYPLGSSGLIAGCNGGAVCAWGAPFVDENDTLYMVELPVDPKSEYSYYYDSDGTYYQLYARLENTLDGDVPTDVDDEPQVYSGLLCGELECNYGVASGNTTPDENRVLVADE